MLTLILTLILLLIFVDFKIHVNMTISHDANLGARFSFFSNTTANGTCDADINRISSMYTSMDASSTNAIHEHQ